MAPLRGAHIQKIRVGQHIGFADFRYLAKGRFTGLQD